MDTFAIELEPTPFGVYLPGQTVKGSVVVANRTIVLFKQFHVKAKGYAWTRYQTSNHNSRYHDGKTIHTRHHYERNIHTENEFYFNMTIPLVVIPNGVKRIHQAPGFYRFPFSFTLPDSIPSTCEIKENDKIACVRYMLKAVMHNSWHKKGFVCRAPITVNTIVDLNFIESPMTSCRLVQHGKLQVEAWINKTCFVPGDNIIFSANILNCSSNTVRCTSVELVQKASFRSRGRPSSQHPTIRTVLWRHANTEKLEHMGMQVWNSFSIAIPPCPPSSLPFCSIIDLSYCVELTVDLGLFSRNVVYTLNIVVGNVPLRESAPTAVQSLNNSLPGSSRVTVSPQIRPSVPVQQPISDGSGSVIESPPPSYEECTAAIGFPFSAPLHPANSTDTKY